MGHVRSGREAGHRSPDGNLDSSLLQDAEAGVLYVTYQKYAEQEALRLPSRTFCSEGDVYLVGLCHSLVPSQEGMVTSRDRIKEEGWNF